ncbi:hypothetical protein BHE74_00005954 [Ensete ventricosum]|nr:hypothetical protein BHE74_00005954 [Ensete ventricosum]
MGVVLEIGDVAMGEGEERDTSPIVVPWEGKGSSMRSELVLEALKAPGSCERLRKYKMMQTLANLALAPDEVMTSTFTGVPIKAMISRRILGNISSIGNPESESTLERS